MNTKTIKDIERLLGTMTDVNHPFISECQQDSRKGVQHLVKRWLDGKKEELDLEISFLEMSKYESALYKRGINYIAGIDEVGRGPLAGPVVAAAVILPRDFKLLGINDSKKLTDKKKDELFESINQEALSIGIGIISAKKIDEVNIYEATKLAMIKAIKHLSLKPEHLLIDAMKLPVQIPQTSIIKGDATSISIAASSIIAKVTRDRLMKRLGVRYPLYGFEKHMGYGTSLHIDALNKHGATAEHRQSFAPVANVMKSI